jgi:hypothetical protein
VVATTAGTTGVRSIFLADDRSVTVTTALTVRMLSGWLTASDAVRILAGGGRLAVVVVATGGHFAAVVGATRQQKSSRWLRHALRVFYVHTPCRSSPPSSTGSAR